MRHFNLLKSCARKRKLFTATLQNSAHACLQSLFWGASSAVRKRLHLLTQSEALYNLLHQEVLCTCISSLVGSLLPGMKSTPDLFSHASVSSLYLSATCVPAAWAWKHNLLHQRWLLDSHKSQVGSRRGYGLRLPRWYFFHRSMVNLADDMVVNAKHEASD